MTTHSVMEADCCGLVSRAESSIDNETTHPMEGLCGLVNGKESS